MLPGFVTCSQLWGSIEKPRTFDITINVTITFSRFMEIAQRFLQGRLLFAKDFEQCQNRPTPIYTILCVCSTPKLDCFESITVLFPYILMRITLAKRPWRHILTDHLGQLRFFDTSQFGDVLALETKKLLSSAHLRWTVKIYRHRANLLSIYFLDTCKRFKLGLHPTWTFTFIQFICIPNNL